MKYKLFILLLIAAFFMSSTVSTYAVDTQQNVEQQGSETTDLVIDESCLDLSKSEMIEYEVAADALGEELKEAQPNEYSQIIRSVTSNLEITEKIGDIAGEYTDNTNEIPSVSLDCDELIQTYQLDLNTSVEVTPLYVAVEEFQINNNQDEHESDSLVSKVISLFVDEAYAGTAVKSIGGRSTKTFYATGYGYKMLTMSVGMYFCYDGTKAWYKSDFDAYWVKYFGGALIQVQDWNERREASGSSYQGWCSGVFGEGIVIEGNLLSLSSKYLKVKVSCSKDGVITRT